METYALTAHEAQQLQDGLIGRAVEDRLLLPIVLYKTARTAGVATRGAMTYAELEHALKT